MSSHEAMIELARTFDADGGSGAVEQVRHIITIHRVMIRGPWIRVDPYMLNGAYFARKVSAESARSQLRNACESDSELAAIPDGEGGKA